MNAEIIAVGSELLLGQIANTNGQFISKELAGLGINVYYHTVVGDNRQRMHDALSAAQERADILIFCGGLGPTKDDMTKEIVADALQRNLITDEAALAQIHTYFEKKQQTMTANNKKQADVIEGSQIFANKYGMAPGMALTAGGQIYILLPGPPRELAPMFTNDVQAYLLQQSDTQDHIDSRVLRFFGIGESKLENEISDLIEAQTDPTIAPLAGTEEVTLRLTAKSRTPEEAYALLDPIESTILDRIGSYFYGYGETTLAGKIFHMLKNQNLTIACAESLTGGGLAQELTHFSGSSAVFKGGIVCYTNEVKENVLGVDGELLQTDGAVSEKCARTLAENVKQLTQADIGISFTGVAGPEMSEGKSVGTVYIGIAFVKAPTHVYPLTLVGSREKIRAQSINYGLFYLLKMLETSN